jgi:F0F1-type ATP synthase alpha subunit
LKQPQYLHYSFAQEALLLFILSGNLCDDVPPKEINVFFKKLLTWLDENNPEVLLDITNDDEITQMNAELIKTAIQSVKADH